MIKLPDLNVINFFSEFAQFKLQLYEWDPERQVLLVGSKWRRRRVIIGTINGICYCLFQVFRFLTKPHHSIEQVSLDLVWIIGAFVTVLYSGHSLVYGEQTAHFVSVFLHFVKHFTRKLSALSQFKIKTHTDSDFDPDCVISDLASSGLSSAQACFLSISKISKHLLAVA
jgi:hypothetical protein